MQSPDLKGLTVLVVEDEPLLRRQLGAEIERLGADATLSATLETARRSAEAADFDFILLDVHLPDGLGTAWLAEGKLPKNTGVIIMTAHGEVSGAVEAMRLGALDYLVKPFEPAQVALVLAKARRQRQSARLEEFRTKDGAESADQFLFGSTLAEVAKQLEKILAADLRMQQKLPPVLVQGETGTGKTTIARWIHQRGPRASSPLVEVNCSALPETLAESELFGHERGAFTDARTARIGLFEAANGGTLFLDELPSLSLPLQAKVLKAIEDHRIRRLGGNREIAIDVRIIAAATTDLPELVASGRFRADLFHRLDLYRLSLPPLRRRTEDLPALVKHLQDQICRRHRIDPREISAAGLDRLRLHAWPGNVRELAHEIERATVFEETAELEFAHLNPSRPADAAGDGPTDRENWFNPQFVFPAEGFSLEEAIRQIIQHALEQTGQNVSRAARLLGVSRDYLRYRLANPKTPSTSDPSDGNQPGE